MKSWTVNRAVSECLASC